MKLVTVLFNGQRQAGVMNQELDGVYLLDRLPLKKKYESVLAFIQTYDDEDFETLKKIVNSRETEAVTLAECKLLAPMPNPPKDVICLGLNYMDHVAESDRFKKKESTERKETVYFLKRVDEAVGPDGMIESHGDITKMLDYEVELGVVIGKGGRYIKGEDTMQSIFGYTVVNDISARDLQVEHIQWTFGKCLDGFTPIGPWIVTADEIPDPSCLQISSKVNGELRQNNNTKNMIFTIPYVIEELSKGITLVPGDIIATGTPSGVGMGFEPPKYMEPGDICECTIEKIGTLRNTVQ